MASASLDMAMTWQWHGSENFQNSIAQPNAMLRNSELHSAVALLRSIEMYMNETAKWFLMISSGLYDSERSVKAGADDL